MNQSEIDYKKVFESCPGNYLLLLNDENFTIIGVSDSYLETTNTKKDVLMGKGVFEAFPDDPNDLNATGVANLTASFHRLLETKIPDQMPLQKYDTHPQLSGRFEEKFWKIVNVPILDGTGGVKYILNTVSEVTK